MKVLSLELTGYKRFALNNINYFQITPVSKHQMILGTNGSGKSSLVSEMTPWIPDPADFVKGGSKVIKISHRNSIYKLSSFIESGTKHSFIKDDVELNQGGAGTGTVQKDLIWQEFGITSDIKDLITDNDSFHRMSPSKRREWFTKLSDISFDYALSVYNRLRESLRDTSGALKLAKNRLVTEKAKMLSEEEEGRIRGEIARLQSELERYQAMRRFGEPNPQAILRDVSRNSEQLTSNLARYRRSIRRMSELYRGENISIIETRMTTAIREKEVNSRLMSEASTEYRKAKEIIDAIKKTGDRDRETIAREIDQKQSEEIGLRARLLCPDVIDCETAVIALESVYEPLVEVLSAFPNASEFGYTKTEADNKKSQREFLHMTLAGQDKTLSEMSVEFRHLEAHRNSKTSNCPKCKYSWIEGYNEERHKQLTDEIPKMTAERNETQAKIKELSEWIDGYTTFGELYRSYIQLTRAAPAFASLWDIVAESKELFNYPRMVLSKVQRLHNDKTTYTQLARLTSDIKELGALLTEAEKLGAFNIAAAEERFSRAEENIGNISAAINFNTMLIANCGEYLKAHNEFEEAKEKLRTSYNSLGEDQEAFVDNVIEEMLIMQIAALQNDLALQVSVISEIDIRKGVVNDLEANIATMEVDEEALKVMVKEMSPTEGLIAEGLLGFIKVFTKQMNKLLKQIWAYPLRVLPCGISTERGAELDYKFPIAVGSDRNVKSDVSKGSTGIREVIDLAFKIVAMRYLDMGDWPLFLDEFGKSFDDKHRSNAVYTIKSLLDVTNFSQLYMVSHYQESYGAFNNADICVICPSNIATPDERASNHHVVIRN